MAAESATEDLSARRFYHGTRADLKPGDLIEPGYGSNFRGFLETDGRGASQCHSAMT